MRESEREQKERERESERYRHRQKGEESQLLLTAVRSMVKKYEITRINYHDSKLCPFNKAA